MSEKCSFGEAMVKVKKQLKGPAATFMRNGDLTRVLGRLRRWKQKSGRAPPMGAISYALIFTDWMRRISGYNTPKTNFQQRIEKRWQEIIDSANERGVKPPENYSGLRLQAMSCLWQILDEEDGGKMSNRRGED